MPNWCENDLTVEGPKDVIEEFVKFAAGDGPFDFNRFLPYPEEFQRLDEIAEAWDRDNAGKSDSDWRLRPKDGFNAGGYDWRVTNWGTKWSACHIDVEGPEAGYDPKTAQVIFHFDTAWSPPLPVIAKAAELFPALRFDLRYFECGGQFNGMFYCSEGKTVSDESGPYFGDRGG